MLQKLHISHSFIDDVKKELEKGSFACPLVKSINVWSHFVFTFFQKETEEIALL